MLRVLGDVVLGGVRLVDAVLEGDEPGAFEQPEPLGLVRRVRVEGDVGAVGQLIDGRCTSGTRCRSPSGRREWQRPA